MKNNPERPKLVALPPRGYHGQVVTILEELLTEARDGKIDAIITCSRVSGQWVHDYSGCDNCFEAIGVLEKMKTLQLRRTDAT